MGPDPLVLRTLADEVETIFRADPGTLGIRSDWRGKVKTLQPMLAQEQKNRKRQQQKPRQQATGPAGPVSDEGQQRNRDCGVGKKKSVHPG